MSIRLKTASQLSEMLANKECSSKELTKEYIKEIKDQQRDINSFITVTEDIAIEQAEKADKLISEGKGTALTGVPVAVKDNISTKGVLTSCASKMLSNYVSPYNATVVEHMYDKGLVLLGKTNMSEFAIGTSGSSSYYGNVLNPWNTNHTAGGSSSGSASAVAMGETPLALGTDTGGSIRVPSAYCGVVGFKPTYGTVSRYGAVALASSFDQIGPMAKSVKDVAMLFDVIKGNDPMDATSTNKTLKSSLDDIKKPLKGVKIGIINEFIEDSSKEVSEHIQKAIKVYQELGATISEVNVPFAKDGLSAYYILSSSEISSNLGRFDGVRYGFRAEDYSDYEDMFIKTRSQGFGADVQKRILLGNYFLSKDQYDEFYARARGVEAQVTTRLIQLFESCDIILTPTTTTTAYTHNEDNNLVENYKSDLITAPVNLAGLPAISIPCGVGNNNLPIGLHLVANKFADNKLLNVAYQYELSVGGFPMANPMRGEN